MAEATPKQSAVSRLRDFLFRPSSLSLVSVVAIGMISGLVFWGGFNTGMEATNQLGFCTSLPRDARHGVPGVQGNHPLQEPLGRARDLFRLSRAQGLDAQVRAQDPGEPGALRQIRDGIDRHAGEVRGEAHGAGAARLGDDEGQRFARMPQLPLLGRDGSAQADRRGPAPRWRRRRRKARRASTATRASRTCCRRNTTRTRSDMRRARIRSAGEDDVDS